MSVKVDLRVNYSENWTKTEIQDKNHVIRDASEGFKQTYISENCISEKYRPLYNQKDKEYQISLHLGRTQKNVTWAVL